MLFNELSKTAKENAIQKNTDINVFDGWHDNCIADFKEILSIVGFENPDFCYSGFYSQGDGASFFGDYKYKKGCLKKLKNEFPTNTELHNIVKGIYDIQKTHFFGITCRINCNNHRYSHSNTMGFDFDNIVRADQTHDYFYTVFNNKSDELVLIKLFSDLADNFYNILINEYNYLTSDEQVTYALVEYDFTENGEIKQWKI